MTIAAVHR